MQSQPCLKNYIELLQKRQLNFYHDLRINSPIVSIISAFFNINSVFEETYQAIINQTFQNFEWIIVDDYSTNLESITLFKSLPQRTQKIKTFSHTSNKGVAASRNTAISHASGKYLFFIDLDDIVEPTYIEKCVLFLETHPEFSYVNSYGIGFQEQEYCWTHGFEKSTQFIQQNWVNVMLMYRKKDFEQLGGFDEDLRFYEDWERWLRAIVNNQKGWTIPEYLHCYRRSSLGLLLTSLRNLPEEKRVFELIVSLYEEKIAKIQNPLLNKPSSFDLKKFNKLEINNSLNRQSSSQRILCFFPWLEVGGADKFNLNLLTLLTNRGYEITIATTIKSQHPWHHYFYNLTPDIFHLPNFLHETHWLAFAKYIIESRQIDIVFISNSYIAYYFLPLLRQEFPNVAFVDYIHCEDPGWRSCGYPRVSCQFSQFLESQIVSSQYLAKFYKNLNPHNNSNIQVCYTNEDTSKWIPNQQKREALRSELGIGDDQVVLLFPARVTSQKRPLLLVDIVKELVEQSLPVSVITLGHGDLLPQMQAKIANLNLQSVFQVIPPVEPSQMIDYYSAADILLLPTEYEGISLAIYEAMSMQLPVVASDVGGQRELVTPETGFLIAKGKEDANEVQAYLNVLVPLIKNQELREKLGFFARQRIAESFSLEVMCDRIEAIFTEAINLRKAAFQPKIDQAIAEEMLIVALENLQQEELSGHLWREKCRIEQEKHQLLQEKSRIEHERHELWCRKNAMETSKFWKLRKKWFKVKRRLGLTTEED